MEFTPLTSPSLSSTAEAISGWEQPPRVCRRGRSNNRQKVTTCDFIPLYVLTCRCSIRSPVRLDIVVPLECKMIKYATPYGLVILRYSLKYETLVCLRVQNVNVYPAYIYSISLYVATCIEDKL